LLALFALSASFLHKYRCY